MKKQIVLRLEATKMKDFKIETTIAGISMQSVLESSVEEFLKNPQKWVEAFEKSKIQTVK